MGRLCNINIGIEGIYGWGTGYYNLQYKKCFYSFFRLNKSKQHTFHVGMYEGICDQTDICLYGLYGGLNVHPMQITGILETANSSDTEFFEFQLRDLNILMEELKEWMQTMCGLDINYSICSAITPTPRELYKWNEYKEEN